MASPPRSVRPDPATRCLPTSSAPSLTEPAPEPRPGAAMRILPSPPSADPPPDENASQDARPAPHLPLPAPAQADAAGPTSVGLRARLARIAHQHASLGVGALEAQLDQCLQAGTVSSGLAEQLRADLVPVQEAEASTATGIAAVAHLLATQTAHFDGVSSPLDQFEAELADRDQRLAQVRARLQRAEAEPEALAAPTTHDADADEPLGGGGTLRSSDSFVQLEPEIALLEAQLASIPPTPPRAASRLASLRARSEAAPRRTRRGATLDQQPGRTDTYAQYHAAQAEVARLGAILSRQTREGEVEEMEELDAASSHAHGAGSQSDSDSGSISGMAVSDRRRAARRSWTPTAHGRSLSAVPRHPSSANTYATDSEAEDLDDAASASGSLVGGRSARSRRSSFASARSDTSRASSVGRHMRRPSSSLGYKAADADPEVRGAGAASGRLGETGGMARRGHARSLSFAGPSAGSFFGPTPGMDLDSGPGKKTHSRSGSRGPKPLALVAHSRTGSFVAAPPALSRSQHDGSSEKLELKLLSLQREVTQLQTALRERDEELLHLNLTTRQEGQLPSGPEPETAVGPETASGPASGQQQLEPEPPLGVENDVGPDGSPTSVVSNGADDSQFEPQDETPEKTQDNGPHSAALGSVQDKKAQTDQGQSIVRELDDGGVSEDVEAPIVTDECAAPVSSESEKPLEEAGPLTVAAVLSQTAVERRTLEEAHAAVVADMEAKIAALGREVEALGADNASLHEVNVELVHRLQEQEGLDPREVAELRADGAAAHDALVVLENHVTELTAERDQLTTELNLVRESQAEAASSAPGGNDLLLRELETQRDHSTRARKELTELKAAYSTLVDEGVRKDAELQDLSLKLKALMRRSAMADGSTDRRLLLSPRVPPPTPPPSFPPPPVPVAASASASRRASASVAIAAAGGRDSPASSRHTPTPLGRYGTLTSESSGRSATTVPSSEANGSGPANGVSAEGAMMGAAACATVDGAGGPTQRQLLELEKRLAHTEADRRAHMDIVAMLEAALNDSERAVRRTRVQVAELTRERDQALALNEEVRAAHEAAQQELDAARIAALHSRSESDARLLQEQIEKDQIKARMARDMSEITKTKTSRLFCI